VTASKHSIVRLWNVATAECMHVLAAHGMGGVHTVAIATDHRMVSGGADGTARVWLADKEQLVLGHYRDDKGLSLAVSPQQFNSTLSMLSLPICRLCTQHTSPVRHAVFSVLCRLLCTN
jgi:WD40 repeat protein